MSQPAHRAQPFTLNPLGRTFAAEVSDIDLAGPVDEATLDALRDAFHTHSLLVFRDQYLTEAQQVAFSRRWGELYGHLLSQFLHPQHPEVLVISNIIEDGKPVGLLDAGRLWHADLSYLPIPSAGAFLYGREVPETGGDTIFADTLAAYDALPDDVKAKVAGKKAVHRFLDSYARMARINSQRPQLTEEQSAKLEDVVHPVAFVHPGNGRKGLYISDGFTAEIIGDDDHALLNLLIAHVEQERFQYRHHWQAGDLLLWDNRSTIHQATGGYALPQRRLMYRTTLKGQPLVGV